MTKNKSSEEYFEESDSIFLVGEINEQTYLEISKQLRYKLYLGLSPVKLYINSNGGELESALGIIDEFSFFEKQNKEIWTIAIGEACSSAAAILGFGTKRFATNNALIMLHPMSYDLGESEHQASKSYVLFADKVYNNLMTSLAMRCGRGDSKAINKFINDVRDGHWMDMDEAIKFGIIDKEWDFSLENI